MKMNCLVTGGAGFVGSELVARFHSKGHSVTVIDNLSNGKESNILSGTEFIRANLDDSDTYTKLQNKEFDVIFHIAAQASNAISFADPIGDLQSNQSSTLRLLEFARQKKIKRFIFTSSMSAYGKPQNFSTTEDEPLRPDSPYAIHKAASEQYLRVYGQEFGLKWTTFRLYTTYGANQNLENLDQGLLSIYLAYLLKKQPVVVKGTLTRIRDLIHVSDVVAAIESCIDNPNTFGKVYNICSGQPLSIREILNLLIEAVGEDPNSYPIRELPGTPGDPPITHGSYERAKQDFGFEPKVMPNDGIKSVIDKLLKIANRSTN